MPMDAQPNTQANQQPTRSWALPASDRERRWMQIFGRAVLGVGLFVGLSVLSAAGAHADDCASLSDCFATASTAAQVIAGVAIVVAAAALALPALLRSSRAPSELHDAGVHTERQSGETASGQSGHGGQPQPQMASGQPQTGASGQSASGGPGQGINLPNLPDTPDVPLTPELSGMLSAQQADEGSGGAREYTPQALDQMRALGLSAADVEAVIQGGTATLGGEPGTTLYSSPQSGISALVEATSGRVLAVTRA
jgi:hypothetical protein